MGVEAILVMWHTPSHWGSIWNLALTGSAVLEKKIFENGGWQMDGQRWRWTDAGPWLYYKLNNEPKGSGELIMHFFVVNR